MAPSRRPPRAGALADLSPKRILKQIMLLQTLYYCVAFILILFTTLVAGQPFSPSLILSWKSLRGDTTVGWTLGLCWMLDAVVAVIFLLLLVNRSKLIPDFALTIHFLHFCVTSFWAGEIPKNYLWWALQVCSAALMIVLGIWACQWRELQPMHFGGSAPGPGKVEAGAAGGSGVAGHAGQGGIGDHFARLLGSVSQSQREGRGNYEMVGMDRRDGNV
jgi:hypothetical protein